MRQLHDEPGLALSNARISAWSTVVHEEPAPRCLSSLHAAHQRTAKQCEERAWLLDKIKPYQRL